MPPHVSGAMSEDARSMSARLSSLSAASSPNHAPRWSSVQWRRLSSPIASERAFWSELRGVTHRSAPR